MPELPKFDDEDLKSYGDEEEESALCVFFSLFFFYYHFPCFYCLLEKLIFSRVVSVRRC